MTKALHRPPRKSFAAVFSAATVAAATIAGLGCSNTKPQLRVPARDDAAAAAALPPPAKAATPADVPATSAPCTLDEAPIRFAFNSTELTDDAQRALSTFAACLVKGAGPPSSLVIEGHCDERGTTEYNLALGARRADAVREYLSRLGVDRAWIKTVSYGKERPVDPRPTEEAWAKNRRAQVVGS